MPFLGSSPARGLVGSADIDDNAITLAKMAHGTANQNISYDGSGVPVDVALSAGKVLQVAHAVVSSVATGTTVHVADDTIPQITEGNEAITKAITPAHASNRLVIVANIFHSVAVSANNVITALYQDSTANALAGVVAANVGNTFPLATTLIHEMAAGTTSETTFKIRCSQTASGTWTLNGWGGSRILGGVGSSTLTIWEISA
tara:strand:- start:462 stop:1070 length:609 start_codon:yes stop_codon:yes gene_type:complete